jgi:cytochrome c-type biogenesis protein CcsB
VGLLLLGFLVHSGGILSRMMLSGRWPIHNQYESFIAVSWLGVLVGIIIMLSARQWLFGAAAAAMGTCALLFANTVAIPSREVGNVAAILATSRILYVHVNMVLFSYGLIGLGFFVSLYYLGLHYFQGERSARLVAAGVGGFDQPADDPALLPGRQRLLHDLDQAQMIVLQLAFWLLGVGIMLGAYWADHAWGRWWAWDPKETWSLITWIVYLIAIHVRLGVRQRGLVTAWLSVIGFFVMLWTYWGVNLLLAGLHSYA